MAISAADARPDRAARGSRILEEEEGKLLEATRGRGARVFGRRELLVTLGSATLFLAVAAALVLYLPAARSVAGVSLAAAFVACYAVAARVEFEVGLTVAVPTQLVFVPMLFLLPLRVVPLLVALALLLSRLPDYLRGSWHASQVGLHLFSAWYALGPVLVLAAAGAPGPTLRHLPLLAAALAAQFALDFGVTAAWSRFGLGVSPRPLVRGAGPTWLVDVALTPLGLALAYASLTQRYAFLLGLPLIGLLAYFARERRARIDHALELSHAYRGTALLLGDMVEADDAYTGLHSRDVVSLVLAVADRLELGPAQRRQAELTALLHDVGKVRVPNEIINKPGPLTAEERAVVELHTVEGERMLDRVGGLLGEVGHLVRSCHERWDGGGYPDGLAGEAIPLVSRIVCACDAFSAMTSDRAYRAAMSRADAIVELRACAGTQFDPWVVEAVIAIVGAARPQALVPAA